MGLPMNPMSNIFSILFDLSSLSVAVIFSALIKLPSFPHNPIAEPPAEFIY